MRPALRPALPRLAALALALALAVSTGAVAAPSERGLAEERDAGLLQQVRERASELVLTAMNFLGVPYRRGGQSEAEGFDCSGFTRFIFERSLGLVLPRRVDEQASAPGLATVRRDDLQPGDLVFFNTLKRSFSHVGIYLGQGRFIHSPRSGATVRVEDMTQAYWSQRYSGARRASEKEATPAFVSDVAATLLAPRATEAP